MNDYYKALEERIAALEKELFIEKNVPTKKKEKIIHVEGKIIDLLRNEKNGMYIGVLINRVDQVNTNLVKKVISKMIDKDQIGCIEEKAANNKLTKRLFIVS